MSEEDHPLPYGWIKQFDRISNHPFWVDTKAVPPRSIWTHPYEDEQYLSEHPDVREKVGKDFPQPQLPRPVDKKARRHSFSGVASDDLVAGASAATTSTKSATPQKKRGLFAKLKDKTIGTKEEREADRLRWAEIQERRRLQRLREQAYYDQQYQQYQYNQGGYYGGYGPPMQYRQRGGGGFGLGAPLLGGLVGGLLLGDILDGGFGGGGFGGGGFDGGFF